MILWLALRNLRVRWASTAITVCVVALATAIAILVPLIANQAQRGAQEATQVFDLLISKKGSPTQAVISSLFYQGAPIGNLPYTTFLKLERDERSARVIPLGFGDNYAGFPIVGTSQKFFEQRLKPTFPPYFQLEQGNLFAKSFDAVLGAQTALSSGLKIGDTFTTEHGIHPGEPDLDGGVEHEEHSQKYTVTGTLEPTGGPADRAVFTPIQSLWDIHGIKTDEAKEVTAILYTSKSINGLYSVAQETNASLEAQAVFPGQVFAQVKDFLSQGEAIYAALATLVLVLAALTIWLSVFSDGLERQKRVALLRALGAKRALVFGLVLLETFFTVALGLGLGIALGYFGSAVGGNLLGQRLGFTLAPPRLELGLLLKVLALLPLGLVAALPPAIRTARQSPLEHL
jgi:putative ABC transport system permease protein